MRSTRTVLAIGVNTLGLAAFLAGVFYDGHVDGTDLRAGGLAVFLGSLVWHLITKGRRSEEDVWEAGRQSGYDAGVLAERRRIKPVLVPIAGGLRSVSRR